MTKQVNPPRAHRIQIAAPFVVVQPGTLTMTNRHERQRLVMLHLCTRVPNAGETAGYPIGMCYLVHCFAIYILNKPNLVSGIGALSAADNPSASTVRVSAGSITPSSHKRALA